MFNLLREDRSNCAEGPAGQLPLDSEQNGFLQLSLALQKRLVPRFFAVTPTGELMITSGESFGKVFATRPALQNHLEST